PPEYIGFIFPLILSFQAAAAGKEPCASVGSRSRSPPASARAEIGKRAGACRIVAGLQNPPFVASAAQLRPAARHSPPIHRSSGGPNRSAPRAPASILKRDTRETRTPGPESLLEKPYP